MALWTILRCCPACRRRVISSTHPLDARTRHPFACPECRTSLRAPWFAKVIMHLWLMISELLMFVALFPVAVVIGAWLSGWGVSAAVVKVAIPAALSAAVAIAGFAAVLSLYPIRVHRD